MSCVAVIALSVPSSEFLPAHSVSSSISAGDSSALIPSTGFSDTEPGLHWHQLGNLLFAGRGESATNQIESGQVATAITGKTSLTYTSQRAGQ